VIGFLSYCIELIQYWSISGCSWNNLQRSLKVIKHCTLLPMF